MERPCCVIAYFADDVTRTYQLAQWLPVLEVLDERLAVVLVLRDHAAAAEVAERTSLTVRVAPSFPELTALYEELDAKVALYCNNSTFNFQSLVSNRMLHVHVNHGESDKQSMASNNAKAYDRVFVAGPAAVERHAAGLLDFDLDRLVQVGRPQLDLRPEPLLPRSPRRTVLYAPTWEGDAEFNDYTSLVTLGRDVVRAVLSLPDARLVYKPHPKVATSLTPEVRAAHHDVLALLASAATHDPAAGHVAVESGDVLAVMPVCDLLLADVSSVGPDWLYLRTEKPIVLLDPHHDPERLRRESPISRAADVVGDVDVAGLTALLAARLERDEHHLARRAMRHHYFGDRQVGESTTRFLDAVGALVERRDQLVGPTAESGSIA